MNHAQNAFGYNLFTGILDEVPALQRVTINTINQYSFCLADKDMAFKKALQTSDILLPDGIGIVAAEAILSGRKIKKISGSTIHQHLLKRLNAEGGSCFYLGSSQSTLQKIKDRVAVEYPSIRVEFHSPPFKSTFSDLDNERMVNEINNFNPDVLFIGMTAPKQEKWATKFKEQINARTICSVGAVFDFYAGTVKRPGKMWIGLGLEWLGRLISEPKRMWKRYLYYGPVFVYIVVKKKLAR
ncbi:MAG: WecB/TagA/CpsF family glycosyltransferase [Pyrinomonadaceae bacterium]|nr:WecB/TagA/CpsF family glycosyltransferase [Sphingobacteriaceae bacterium]